MGGSWRGGGAGGAGAHMRRDRRRRRRRTFINPKGPTRKSSITKIREDGGKLGA